MRRAFFVFSDSMALPIGALRENLLLAISHECCYLKS
jgi:hypothetical protein